MTQADMVADHLNSFGSITPMEADQCYAITRLADVVYKLKKRGVRIKTVTEYGKNRFGRPVCWARYVKEKDND